MALLDDLDRRRERELRDSENSARLAQAYANFTTTGLGTLQYEDRVDFGTTFIERPFVSHAAHIDMDLTSQEMQREADDDNVPLPLITGYVTEWDQDERGFYAGCWLAVRVFYPDTDLILTGGELDFPLDPKVEIEHHFTFAAIAMKDIPMTKEDVEED